jgi:hypothetical protein
MVIFVGEQQPDFWQYQLGSIYFNTSGEADADGCLWTMPEPDGWESPTLRVNAVDIPYADGQDLGDIFFNTRTIHGAGEIIAPSAAAIDRAKSRLLRETRLLRQDGKFVGRDSLGSWYANCRRGDRTTFPNRAGPEATTFDFVLIAGDPLKYATSPTVVKVENRNPTVGGLISPWTAPLISTPLDTAEEVTTASHNLGDLAAPFFVDFNGPLTNPKLYDRVNGFRIVLNTYVPEGRSIRVDPALRTVMADDVSVWPVFDGAASTPMDRLLIPAESSCAWVLISQGAGHALVTHRNTKE